jgi:hypothetical protein
VVITGRGLIMFFLKYYELLLENVHVGYKHLLEITYTELKHTLEITKIEVKHEQEKQQDTIKIATDKLKESSHALKVCKEILDKDAALISSLKAENTELKKQLSEFEDLDPREKNTLLKIIAVMAKANYGDLFAEPYALGDKISKEAASLKIDIKPRVIGDKIKAAKDFLLR